MSAPGDGKDPQKLGGLTGIDLVRRTLEEARAAARAQGKDAGRGRATPAAPRRGTQRRSWSGPGPEYLGPLWFLLKAMFVFLLVTWIRWSFVRIRVDQILALSWKALLPATLMLLISTAVVVVWRTGGF